jgi:Family of unknown function (DUF6158)
MSDQGVPAGELSDEELVNQGIQAHATRTWVFLHGTAEQFRRHTERMLELEQEYLQRYPKRTWQGSGGAAGNAGEVDLGRLDLLAQIRLMTRNYSRAIEQLLVDTAEPELRPESAQRPDQVEDELLRRYAAAPGGRMHKLEAHQAAREVGLPPAAVAALFKADPPLLVTAGEFRQITDAGRARLR